MESVIDITKNYIQELKDERDEAKEDYKRLLKTAEGIADENRRFREVLSYVVELDCIPWKRDELAEMARKALAGESND